MPVTVDYSPRTVEEIGERLLRLEQALACGEAVLPGSIGALGRLCILAGRQWRRERGEPAPMTLDEPARSVAEGGPRPVGEVVRLRHPPLAVVQGGGGAA